jgi:hypothetical protein
MNADPLQMAIEALRHTKWPAEIFDSEWNLVIDRDNVRYVALADLDAIDDKIKRDAGALSVVDLSRRIEPAAPSRTQAS